MCRSKLVPAGSAKGSGRRPPQRLYPTNTTESWGGGWVWVLKHLAKEDTFVFPL